MISETSTPRRVGAGDVVFYACFLAYAGGALALLAQGAGAVFASLHEPFHEWLHLEELGLGTWARTAKRMGSAHEVLPSLLTIALGYAFSLLSLVLAVLMLKLRPRDRTARLLAVGMVGTAGIFNLTSQVTMEALPLTPIESVVQAGAHIAGGLAFVYALLLFPDGRPVPRWPAPALAVLYLPATAAAVFLALRVQGTARPAALLTFFGLAVPVAGVAAQAYRFRRADNEAERQQARLLFWALLPALGIGLYFVIFQGLGTATDVGLAGRHLPEQPVVVFRVFQPVFALIPLALFLGLIRYRLWDIDRVINRTLVYAVATGALAAAYWGIVVVLQRAFRSFTQGNELAIAASTLAVAAAFVPVRSRIQAFVDRRFYRSHYDAVRTVEAFATTLRSSVDLESLGTELRTTVCATMQPEHVSLLTSDGSGGLGWQWTYRPSSGARSS